MKLSWQNVDELICKLVKKIKEDQPNIDSIYGIPRGGLIPAVMLSHKLDLPLVSSPTQTSLIVDEICDTGETLKGYKCPSAVLVWREEAVILPYYVGGTIPKQADWVIFPWENTGGA